MPTVYDHLVVFSFAVLLPAYAKWNYGRFRARVTAGVPNARSIQYRKTTLRQWALAAVALAVWFGGGRSATTLGLGLPLTPGLAVSIAAAVAISLLWRAQIRAAMREPQTREILREKLEVVAPILPSTERELSLFSVLSLTAGICEELLFRGYLIAYLSAWIPLGAAAVLSGILFGLGHLYQGGRQAVKIIFVGWLFAAFYVGSGSLWVPMVLHALLDLAQGRLAFRLTAGERVTPTARV